jgi:hypothetical protein
MGEPVEPSRHLGARILAALTEDGWIAETAQIDSSYIKAHRCAGGGKGGLEPTPPSTSLRIKFGISRGGRPTKIHALVDVLGRPHRLALTPGTPRTSGCRPTCRCDCGYEARHC